jgi:hypothetical protein
MSAIVGEARAVGPNASREPARHRRTQENAPCSCCLTPSHLSCRRLFDARSLRQPYCLGTGKSTYLLIPPS